MFSLRKGLIVTLCEISSNKQYDGDGAANP
jgi:hypothetical protein